MIHYVTHNQRASSQADADVQADNAQLVLLGAQSEMGLGHVERMDAQALLEASVERHAQLAFDILAAAGHEFRKKNRSGYTECILANSY